MFNKIIKFIKYHNAFTVVLAIVLLGFSGAMASETVRDATLGKAVVEKNGVNNSALLLADLDNFVFSMRITDVSEDEENYYVTYSYQTMDIADDAWRKVDKKGVLTISRSILRGRDMGLYVAEELGEIIDSQLAYLKKVKEKEIIKGQTLVRETTAYTGLIGLVLNPKTRELPGYEPVVKPPARPAFVARVSTGETRGEADSSPDSVSGSDELCAGSVCINEEQLKALLENPNDQVPNDPNPEPLLVEEEIATSTPEIVENPNLEVGPPSGGETPTSASTTPQDTEPPTLTLQGANPAEIEVGSTYSDMGVKVEDNVDHNLGYEVWRDGILLGRNLSGVSVDTASSTEHTISYSATDQAGNTATTTRNIIVANGQSSVASTTPEIIFGCTDNVASNYNSEATEDDGTCEYIIVGCMDNTAENYNADATEDDGSCTYPEPEPTATTTATTTPNL